MAVNLLTARAVELAAPATKPYWLRDGGSLFLYVTPSGGKHWRYRYRLAQSARTYSIGPYPTVDLMAARAERDRARGLVRQGMHPLQERRERVARQLQHNQETFAAAAGHWMQAHPEWSPYYRQQISRYLARDVLPHLGQLPLRAVQALHLRPVVQAVALRGAESAAMMVRQWISQIFSHAAGLGWCEHDPAALLKGMVRKPQVRHHVPLPWSDIGEFLHRLQAWHGNLKTRIALQLLVLTFVRTVELRRATWDEFDLASATWMIPAAHMKMRRPHIVPLSRQAVRLLRALGEITGRQGLVIPNARRSNDSMGPSTLNRVLDRLGYAGRLSAHGFRATATTLLGLLGYPENRVDLQLAHARRDSSRAPYDHTRYISSRRLMMQDWADILDALQGGAQLAQLTNQFGPLSERRDALLRVVEREQ